MALRLAFLHISCLGNEQKSGILKEERKCDGVKEVAVLRMVYATMLNFLVLVPSLSLPKSTYSSSRVLTLHLHLAAAPPEPAPASTSAHSP